MSGSTSSVPSGNSIRFPAAANALRAAAIVVGTAVAFKIL
jgi:hypothetical protein